MKIKNKHPYKIGDLVYMRGFYRDPNRRSEDGVFGERWYLSIVLGFGQTVYSQDTIILYNVAQGKRVVRSNQSDWISENMRLVP